MFYYLIRTKTHDNHKWDYKLNPRCSLIILAYNQQEYIYEGIKAAFEQLGEPIEIIISDDASSDNTFTIIEQAIANYSGPNKVIANRNAKNMGIIAHTNKIVKIAKGEIIIPSYGDDISLPNRTKRILEEFDKYNPLLIHSHAIPINEKGEQVKSKYDKATFFKTVNPLDISTSLSHYLGASGAWHRKLFDKYGPIKSELVYDDHILGFRAALEKRVRLINEPLLYYREGVGISHSMNKNFNKNDNKQNRKKILTQAISVYNDRIEDAFKFGLAHNDPIVTKLDIALVESISRLSYHQSKVNLLEFFLKNPRITLNAVLSELLRDLRRR